MDGRIAQLQASLTTASEAERGFIEAQIAFARDEGQVLGQDLASLSARAKVDLVQRIVGQARERGLHRQVRAFESVLADLLMSSQSAASASEDRPGRDGTAEALDGARQDVAERKADVERLVQRVTELHRALSEAETAESGA